jgi:hypothetical protein
MGVELNLKTKMLRGMVEFLFVCFYNFGLIQRQIEVIIGVRIYLRLNPTVLTARS